MAPSGAVQQQSQTVGEETLPILVLVGVDIQIPLDLPKDVIIPSSIIITRRWQNFGTYGLSRAFFPAQRQTKHIKIRRRSLPVTMISEVTRT